MIQQLDVLTIGGATEDFIFYSDEGVLVPNQRDLTRQRLLAFELGAKIKGSDVRLGIGGGGTNVAVSLARLGFRVGALVAVGRDDAGRRVTRHLAAAGVSTRFVKGLPGTTTGLSFIVTNVALKDHVAFLYRGANDHLTVRSADLARANPRWLYVSSLSGKKWRSISEEVVRYRTSRATKLAWNPGETQLSAGARRLAPLLQVTDLLVLNKDEAIELILSAHRRPRQLNSVPVLLRAVASLGPRSVVITWGRRGAWGFDGRRTHWQKIYPAVYRESIGAGDATGSTVLGGLLLFNGDLKKALKLAVINSASVISHVGTQTGLLARKDIVRKFRSFR